MKKIILIAILLFSLTSVSYAGWFDWLSPSVGAPTSNVLRDLIPETTSTYSIGSDSKVWLEGFFDTATTTSLCFNDNTCMTTAPSGLGTVTSVDMSVPTGLTIAGNPITTSGTLALSLTAGYQMLTDVASTTWDNKWDLTAGVFDPYGQATSTKDWLLAQNNTWTGLQTMANASTTLLTSTTSWLGNILSGIWNGTAIDFGTYTNATVSSPITLTDDDIGFDFTTANSWTGLNTFANASTTQLTIDALFDDDGDIGTNGQVFTSTGSGTDWTSAGAGTVTSIATTYPIFGGTITETGTLSLSDMATTTLAGTGAISITNTPYVIGGTGAVVSCATADTDTVGCLSDTDWDTFNNKTDTFAGFEIDGASQTSVAPTFDFDGTIFSIVEDPADDFDINIVSADTDTRGVLTSTDWDTFNDKQSAFSSIAGLNALFTSETVASTTQSFYIGTTQVAINRASATLNLAGIGTLGVGAITSSGTLALGANSLTMTGSLGGDGTELTKGWFTDLDVTNAIAGSVTGNAGTVTGFTPASGSLTLAGADALTITTSGATNSTLPLGTKTLVATDVATLSSLTSIGTIGTGTWEGTDIGLSYIAGGTADANIYNFGGATSFEIPNGANPTVDTLGEMGLDTTDDQLIVMGATEKVIRTDEAIFRFTLASTTPEWFSGGSLPVPPEKDGYTITSYSCYVTGGTSVVLTPSGATQGDLDAITCATTITKDTTMTATSIILADELVEMKIGAITGVVDYVSFTAFGKWVRE